MVSLRALALAGLAGLMVSCLDQYDPRPFWKKLESERQMSSRVLPQLTVDGKLPALVVEGTATVAEAAFNAEKVFQSNCVACHGPDGQGNPAMNARNFTDGEWQSIATDAEIAAVILHGAMNAPKFEESLNKREKFKLQFPTMIGWEHLFSGEADKKQEQVAELVKYIRHFKK